MSDAMDRKEEKERTMTGRNKNMVCGALLCAMMLSMTACGNEIPDLTEEESQRVGEYAAVTLLKYDANNRSRLVDPEMVIAKLEKEAAKEAKQGKKLREAVYGNFKLMKRTLTNEQYKKYVQLLNVTLKNKGLDSYMEDAANK